MNNKERQSTELQPLGILFLGGAKRVDMARRFKRAAAVLGYNLQIFSYELSTQEPIAAEATVIRGLRWADPELYADLQRIVAERDIRIVVPFVDQSIEVAARLAEMCPGVFAPTSSVEAARMCLDKLVLDKKLEAAELPRPQLVDKYSPERQLIAKPRAGSASKGIITLDVDEAIRRAGGDPKDYLVQHCISEKIEYSVDSYASVADGRVLAASVRRRNEVLGGEVTDTTTVPETDVQVLAAGCIKRLDLRGAITVQILRDTADAQLYVMEINPRLGGGCVCSVDAGADIPSLIISEAMGLTLKPMHARAHVRMKRFLEGVIFDPNDLLTR